MGLIDAIIFAGIVCFVETAFQWHVLKRIRRLEKMVLLLDEAIPDDKAEA